MSSVFSNTSHHKQILNFIKRILLERKKFPAISDIFQSIPPWGQDRLRRNFFTRTGFIHDFTAKKGTLLFSTDRQIIFYREFLAFVRLRQRMGVNMRYLRRIFPHGEEGKETFSIEALRMLDRLTWHILHQFEEEALKKTEKLKKDPKILEKIQRGEMLLVLNVEGLQALRAGVTVPEILDRGLITMVDESGVLPSDIGRDENGGIFPIMKLFDEDGDLTATKGATWDEATQYFPVEKMAVLFGIFERHGLLIEDAEISQSEIRGRYVEGNESYVFSLNTATDMITIVSDKGEQEVPFAMFVDEMEKYDVKGAVADIPAQFDEKMGIRPRIAGIDVKWEGGKKIGEIPVEMTEEREFLPIRETRIFETPRPIVTREPKISQEGQSETQEESPETDQTAKESAEERERTTAEKPRTIGESDAKQTTAEPQNIRERGEEPRRTVPQQRKKSPTMYGMLAKIHGAMAGAGIAYYWFT